MVRHVTSTLTACMLAGAASLFAQQTSQQEPQQQPSQQEQQQQQQQSSTSETLTGCVQEAKTTEGGIAYILNNAEGGSATMYVLGGSSQSEMAANVSKKVEVTGQVRQPNAPPPDAAESNPKVLRPPIVQVESVKVVADACR